MGVQEKEDFRLPKSFNRQQYEDREAFLGDRPIHHPNTMRDNHDPFNKEKTKKTLEEVLQTTHATDEEPQFDRKSINDDGPQFL